MTPPLAITSTTHPVAVTGYFGLASVGLVTLTGTFTSKAMTAWLGTSVTMVWATALLVAGLLAGLAALAAPAFLSPRTPLAIEGVCAGSVAALLAVYVAAIWGGGAVLTLALLLTLGTGCTARAVQVIRERSKIKRAMAGHVVADPAPLGDPDGE